MLPSLGDGAASACVRSQRVLGTRAASAEPAKRFPLPCVVPEGSEQTALQI